jgi:hypothetical protein
MRKYDPGELANKPNFANLEDLEAKTVQWEVNQRSLCLRQLERSQQPANSSGSAGKVAFPKQLVHDLNVLRQKAGASRTTSSGATATDGAVALGSASTPAPGSGGSVGSSQQVRCEVVCSAMFCVLVVTQPAAVIKQRLKNNFLLCGCCFGLMLAACRLPKLNSCKATCLPASPHLIMSACLAPFPQAWVSV